MTRAGLILSLFVVGLLVGQLTEAVKYKKGKSEFASQDASLNAFQAGYEYVFHYHSQIHIGLVEPKADLESPTLIDAQAEAKQQAAATAFQCQVKIVFGNDGQAMLKIEKPQIGERNALSVVDPKRVQSMAQFARLRIEDAKLLQLQKPCQFAYADGVVEALKFERGDATWSKNVKRAILNLLQVNLKPVNEQAGGEDKMNSAERFYLTKSYSTQEATLEGDCQTTYSINGNGEFRYRNEASEKEEQAPTVYNVTKSIDFKRCKQIADVGFGLQSVRFEQSAQCIQCMQKQWSAKLKSDDNNGDDTFFYENACANECDAKELSEQSVDRSTVIRHMCAGRPESGKCALKRVELISHYVYKNFASQITVSDQSPISSDMQATVVAEMILKDEKKASPQSDNAEKISADSEGVESILYDNEATSEEKLFYMYGDEIFDKKSPFRAVKNKVDQATRSYLFLILGASKDSGIEATSMGTHLPRIIEILRMASVDELKQICANVLTGIKKQQSAGETQKAKQILADTLAMAGTRNTIDVLVANIVSREFPDDKAAGAIAALSQLPAPSDSIVKTVMELLKSEQTRRVPMLKQTCLLTFGALVGELCRYRANNDTQQFVYGRQTGFNVTDFVEDGTDSSSNSNEEANIEREICSDKHKMAYAKTLIAEYDEAESLYGKILALKAIGNAGLDVTVSELLAQIIRGQLDGRPGSVDSESVDLKDAKSDDATIVRVHAIDALRRMSALMPRRIQRLLLPIYSNGGERAELKMAAYSTLMLTSPPRPILDQIVYGMLNERSREVKTFVHASLNAYVKIHQQTKSFLAKHIKDALKLARVNSEDYSDASSWNVKMQAHTSKTQNGANLILNMASVFGADKSEMLQMPSQLSANVHANFGQGGNILRNVVGLSATQSNLSQWAENVMKAVLQFLDELKQKSPTMGRGQRGSSSAEQNTKDADQQMKEIFSALGIQRRQSCLDAAKGASANSECGIAKKGAPFAMFTVRIGDVDKAIIPLEEQALPSALKALVNREKPLMEILKEVSDVKNVKYYQRSLSALNAGEESAVIATSMGIPIRLHHTNPVLIAADGETKFGIEKTSGNYGAVAQIDVRSSVSTVRIRKIEAQWPGQPAVGVESSRAIEAHAPIHVQIRANAIDGLRVQIQTPQVPKTRLLGIHTLTATYTKPFDAETQNFFDSKIRAVHSPQFDALETVVDKVIGVEALGLPLRVSGHFHLPKKSLEHTALGYLAELANLAMSTENHLHVTFEPSAQTPKQIQFQMKGGAFEKVAMSQIHYADGGSLKNFYAQPANRFEVAYPDSAEPVELNDEYKNRNSKLTNFLEKIGKSNSEMFKHSLKLSAQTIGGAKPAKAEAEISAICDANAKYWKLAGELRRSPMLASETEWWALRARADVALPERVSSTKELKELADKKSQILLANAKFEWGAAKTDEAEKQTINIRLQGKCSTEKQLKQRFTAVFGSPMENESEEAQKIHREMSFLNRFDMSADYRMRHSAQNAFARVFEALKSYNYADTETRPAGGSGKSGANALAVPNHQCSLNEPCQIHATLTIDPISQRHANLSIRTVSRAVRIQSLPLPYRMRHFPLVRAQDSPMLSAHQMIKRYAESNLDESRAKCTVDGRSVSTFDDVEYDTAPISRCYTVIAKDCATQKFSVLMKSLDEDGKQKKIKILTPNSVIECYGEKTGAQKKIVCSENGAMIESDDVPSRGQNTVEYNNEEQTMVEIRNSHIGFTVKFGCHCADCKCQKITVKLSDAYKNAQCGICGHFDGDRDAEFRPAGEFQKEEENVSEFVNSYTLTDPKECSLQANNKMIQKRPTKKDTEKESNEWSTGGYIWDEEQEKSASWEETSSKYSNNKNIDNNDQDERMEQPEFENPEIRTMVVEYNHKICFSVETVKQCAEGTTPKTWAQVSDASSAYESRQPSSSSFIPPSAASDEQDDAQGDDSKMIVKFACLERSSPIARRMQREAKHGVPLSEELAKFAPNYSQAVIPPAKCLKHKQMF